MKTAKTKKTAKKGKTQKKRAAQKNDHIPVIRKNAQMFSEGYNAKDVNDSIITTAKKFSKKLSASTKGNKKETKSERRWRRYEEKMAILYKKYFEKGRAILGLSPRKFQLLVKGITAQQHIRRNEIYEMTERRRLAAEKRKAKNKKTTK